eukprot:COSAG05_NODE_354_length_10862_cov_59.954659_11_plen_294_part_00
MSDDGMAMSSAHNPLNSTVNNSVRISVPPVGDADSALDPFLGTNLPMYPALPQSRRLSSFDPEWEDDPDYIAQRTDEAVRAMQQQVLPSADVLKEVLRELHYARSKAPPQQQRPQQRPRGGGRQAVQQEQAREGVQLVEPEMSGATTASAQMRRGIQASKIDVSASAVPLSSGEAVNSVLQDFQGRPFENTYAPARRYDLGVDPEPDLLRVNAGTGSHLQMGSTWMAADPGVALVKDFRAKAGGESAAPSTFLLLLSVPTAPELGTSQPPAAISSTLENLRNAGRFAPSWLPY